MKCPHCNNEEGVNDPIFGVLPGKNCQRQRQNNSLPKFQYEFTSESIKTDRNKFHNDIIQPFRGDQVSKEYIDKYGYQNLGITEKEARKAKKVWR